MKISDLKNLKFVIKGYYKSLIQYLYSKSFDEKSVKELMYRSALCNDCIMNGTCLHCGCATYEMIMSGKTCKRLENENT